ncbi:hypothetical protein Pmar_PMAR008730 [Perkinsus marinus ATCC 50983]|uniref:Uncharacterized protein n=1 Tax=Perkinsus marinus (strain ATCC 50983 / TXsc) TaxID=423536 RepID=C5L0U8_PERM5|nr:hypothetical protein Pmar_PMAR008730 [Perkinsus marinus ATCC 50983]EER09590.1 hypothetical protein Pmar_PMAR008730 [Perkinsus marinus ATCC 50983]|eukprot:XP_002777795.1 hypothetical protein Pmar_PMAR008730 [Perkinsus marinus ATCC 50983]
MRWLATFNNGFTAANYLSHIKKFCIILDLDTAPFDSARIKTAISGLKKSTHRPESLAIRRPLLLKIVEWAKNRKLYLFAAAAVAAYIGMFRVF